MRIVSATTSSATRWRMSGDDIAGHQVAAHWHLLVCAFVICACVDGNPRSLSVGLDSASKTTETSIPDCSEIPCLIQGTDRARGIVENSPSVADVFHGWIRDQSGRPVKARISAFDQSYSPGSQYGSNGAFVAAVGTRPDGSFVLRAPRPSPGYDRMFVVESREGLRRLEPSELPSGRPQHIVVQPVRALPLSILLGARPGGAEETWASVVIERTGEERGEVWARHTLLSGGSLGRRRPTDSVGGLASVSMEGSELRAIVLVPVGQVRVGVTLEQARAPSGGRAQPRWIATNDHPLSVATGAGPLDELSLPVPHPEAGTLEIRYRPVSPDSCRLSFRLRRVGGVLRVFGANTYQARGMALRLPAIAPGVYELGDATDCVETFDVPAGGTRIVTVRDPCAVDCTPIFHCGYGSQMEVLPP